MNWPTKLWRWSSLGIAIAAIGGGLMFGKQVAERHALSSVMGPGARASAIKLHWPYPAGCAEKVVIPLASVDESASGMSQLTAGRLWFSYDVPALLRRRLTFPRVVIEDALIEVRPVASQALAPGDTAATRIKDGRVAAAWLTEMRERVALLEQEKFITGTQVAVDTAMLGEQWRAEFSGMHDRARRVLSEARDIEQQLATLDNVLRHEARVLASRDRLDILKTSLTGMKSELSRCERTLRDQQSHIRESLLVEKSSIQKQGSIYRSPAANEVAEKVVKAWLANCLVEPMQTGRLLADMILKPYAVSQSRRGADIRYLDQPTADLSVGLAKISGNMLVGDRTMPFSATGHFRLTRPSMGMDSAEAMNDARWQMSVGSSLACLSVEGHILDVRDGTAQLAMHSTAPGEIQAKCQMSPETMRGSGRVLLRQWLNQTSSSAELKRSFKYEPLVLELINESLKELEDVPEEVRFQFRGRIASPDIEIGDDASRWLADDLERLASERVAKCYNAAAQSLEGHIHRELDTLTRSVALGRDGSLQHINQLLDELRVVQTNILDNLKQRGGAHFARQRREEVNR